MVVIFPKTAGEGNSDRGLTGGGDPGHPFPDNFQTAIGAMGRTAGKRGPRMARKKGELHLELRATVKVLANAGKNLDEIVELILPMMTTSTS